MHLINPSATRQFLSARLEDESVSPGEVETAERWLNVAVRSDHTARGMPNSSLWSTLARPSSAWPSSIIVQHSPPMFASSASLVLGHIECPFKAPLCHATHGPLCSGHWG